MDIIIVIITGLVLGVTIIGLGVIFYFILSDYFRMRKLMREIVEKKEKISRWDEGKGGEVLLHMRNAGGNAGGNWGNEKIRTKNLEAGGKILIPDNLSEEERAIVRDFYNL
jgi:hypothetical protein